jgi:hypothetical protein
MIEDQVKIKYEVHNGRIWNWVWGLRRLDLSWDDISYKALKVKFLALE